jgi:hypothetical protein
MSQNMNKHTRSGIGRGSSAKRTLLQKIVDMVNMLNERARTHTLHDPLAHVEYHLSMTAPMDQKTKSMNDIAVKITVVYLSGHGEESAHVLNDTVSFTVTDTTIADIEFQDETTERKDRISLTGEHLEDFIDRVQNYCKKHLSSRGGESLV